METGTHLASGIAALLPIGTGVRGMLKSGLCKIPLSGAGAGLLCLALAVAAQGYPDGLPNEDGDRSPPSPPILLEAR